MYFEGLRLISHDDSLHYLNNFVNLISSDKELLYKYPRLAPDYITLICKFSR